MATSTIHLDASVDVAWTQFQRLETWEGVAGIQDLRQPTHDAEGDLSSFRFAIDTTLGRVDGRATVEAEKPKMVVSGSQKGLTITIALELRPAPTGCDAIVEANSKATSFLSMPLEVALNALLESGLDSEAAKIASRITPS